MTDPYDVIVIGSGAGGGTLVHHLAPSGKRILLLERGGWLRREPQKVRDPCGRRPLRAGPSASSSSTSARGTWARCPAGRNTGARSG